MKYSWMGMIAATLFAWLPLLPWSGLFFGSVTTRYLFITVSLSLLIAFAASRIFIAKNFYVSYKRPLLISIGLVLSASLLSMFVGVSPLHSLWSYSTRLTGIFFLAHIILGAVVLGEFLTEKDWSLVRRSIAVSTGVFSLLTLAGAYALGYAGSFLWFDLGQKTISFGNETYAGMYMVLALCIAAVEFLRTKERRWKWIIGVSIGATILSPILINTSLFLGKTSFTGVQSILGLTRASGAVMLAGVLFLAVWWLCTRIPQERIRKLAKAAWAIIPLMGCVIATALLIIPGSPLQERLTDNTTINRFIIWEATTPAILERPLFGWGPENYDRAFESHFNHALYEKEGRIEVWFSNAHNALFDTLIKVGVTGLAALVLLIGAYVLVLYRAWARKDIGEGEYVVLLLLPVAHLLQLQTAFNSLPTYALLAGVGGYALHLERKQMQMSAIPGIAKTAIASLLGIFALVSIVIILGYDLPRTVQLTKSFGEPDAATRAALIDASLSRTSDFDALRVGSTLFIQSVSDAIEESANPQAVADQARPYLEQYILGYERYLAVEPDHYRARINYSYLLLLNQAWGGKDRSQEALSILADSYALSPDNPLTYVLDTTAHVYAGDLIAAEDTYKKMETLYPNNPLIPKVRDWLDTQQQTYPDTSFFVLGNLL